MCANQFFPIATWLFLRDTSMICPVTFHFAMEIWAAGVTALYRGSSRVCLYFEQRHFLSVVDKKHTFWWILLYYAVTGYKYGVGQLLVISFASHTSWWGSWQWDYESWWTGRVTSVSSFVELFLLWVASITGWSKVRWVGRVLKKWYLECTWVMLYEGSCWRWHKRQLYLGLMCHAECWKHSP